MKNKFLFVLLLSVLGFSQKKKINEEYDYINNYYQLVYEAQYEYLHNNYQKAYDLLKKSESICPLLNQTGIYEPKILAQCAFKLGKHNEAFKYATLLLKEHGFQLSFIENDTILDQLKGLKKWKKLEKNASKYYEDFLVQVDIDLRNEIIEMKKDDQIARTTKPIDYDKLKTVDSITDIKLKKIVADCDCYPDTMFSQFGNFSVDKQNFSATVFVMHINSEKSKYWEPIFLDLIKRGRAPASIYGNLIDSNLRSTGMFKYGIYQNLGKENINDFENLNERRIAVGLPTWEHQNFIYNWNLELMKKYNVK